MNKFKVGDVVQLKSGGPEMTVTDAGEQFVTVMYWNPNKSEFGSLHSIDAESLVKVD